MTPAEQKARDDERARCLAIAREEAAKWRKLEKECRAKATVGIVSAFGALDAGTRASVAEKIARRIAQEE